MATMNTDGTIAATPRCLPSPDCGSSAVFQIEATYRALVGILGETDTIEDAEPYWVVLIPSGDDRPNERVSIHHTSNWPREDVDETTLWYVTCYPDARWAAERLVGKLGRIAEFSY